MQLGPRLWTRRPEHWNFLAVRLGTTRALSRNSIAERDTQNGLPEFIERIDRLKERYKYVDDVPLLESLPAVGSVGVAGPAGPAADAMRGLAVQLFGLHAPNGVVTVAFADPDWVEEFEWLKWLPHTTSETNRFKDMPLADSAPTANALLSALEEYIMRAGRTAEHRGPFPEKWNPVVRDRRRAGRGGDQRAGAGLHHRLRHQRRSGRPRPGWSRSSSAVPMSAYTRSSCPPPSRLCRRCAAASWT